MIYLLLIKHSDMKHCSVRLFFKTRRWDSSGGITTGYRLDGRGLNPGKGKIFSFTSVKTGSGAQPTSYSVGTGGSFNGSKAAGT
jgi:hypothetical protein